jgi:hypothetical protein
MPMKLYEVELKRVSFVTYVVEALDETMPRMRRGSCWRKTATTRATPTGKLITLGSTHHD